MGVNNLCAWNHKLPVRTPTCTWCKLTYMNCVLAMSRSRLSGNTINIVIIWPGVIVCQANSVIPILAYVLQAHAGS